LHVRLTGKNEDADVFSTKCVSEDKRHDHEQLFHSLLFG